MDEEERREHPWVAYQASLAAVVEERHSVVVQMLV
jgi:hypothetical protein